MKAVIARELGPPETLLLEDVPSRVPGPNEVRVAVHYAGVSFVDVLIASGGYQLKPPVPFIPGTECSGIVIEAGSDVRDLVPGDRVTAGGIGGIFAEELVLPADMAAKVPAGVDMAEAAVVRSSYLTALYALKNRACLQAGETVLVLGAAGAVGIAAVQIARHYGAHVIASASSAEKCELAIRQGATAAIRSGAPDWRDQLKALTDGRGVDIVIDPLGGDHTERAFRSLAWKGRHVVIGFAAGDIPRLPTNLALLKGAVLTGVDVRQFGIREPEEAQACRHEVDRLMAEGVARPPIARIFPLDDYQEAMKLAATGTALGRVVLQMPVAALT